MLPFGFTLPLVTVAVLHIVNSIEIPWAIFKSYPVYAGVQDVHNGGTGIMRWFSSSPPLTQLMYYFMPKAANRPIYS